MQPLLQTMQSYNKAIQSYKRAEEYFASDEPISNKIARATDCKILVNHISGLIDKIESMSYTMSDEEILEGFRQVEALKL